MSSESSRAVRVVVDGMVQGVGFRDRTVEEAGRLGVTGWVRNGDDGEVRAHAEGPTAAVEEFIAFLRRGPRGARVETAEVEDVGVEGHEQFGIRGVSSGRFVVEELQSGPRYALRLELSGEIRSWLLPKAPSMKPADKRFAIESSEPGEDGQAWDEGSYEQGGRVAWPEALERGHAVFVLHGNRLEGGFALQRTGAGKWLLIKRKEV